MRNMSFFLTTDQFKKKQKTITRRIGWKNLRAGDVIMGCKKCQGLKRGEKIEQLGPIRVKSVYHEPLNTISPLDVIAEGFYDTSTAEFVEMFCKQMKCTPETIVTRIEYEYT